MVKKGKRQAEIILGRCVKEENSKKWTRAHIFEEHLFWTSLITVSIFHNSVECL